MSLDREYIEIEQKKKKWRGKGRLRDTEPQTHYSPRCVSAYEPDPIGDSGSTTQGNKSSLQGMCHYDLWGTWPAEWQDQGQGADSFFITFYFKTFKDARQLHKAK